jgi:hypothetical protein
LVAAERAFLGIRGDDVLAQLGADRLEPVAEAADDREVAPDGVLALGQVAQGDDDEDRGQDAEGVEHGSGSVG